MKLRLSMRLYFSHAVVVLLGALATFITVRLLAPRLFDEQMTMMAPTAGGGMMGGIGSDPAGVHGAFISSINSALLAGIGVALGVAAVAAYAVTSRVLRPIDALRSVTRRIADGDYAAQVPLPPVPEMAALAQDVNTLARSLAATEERRTRLLGDVAHEMRTPLTVLDGYVEGVIDGVFAADATTLEALSLELRRLHRLADDLSTLSRAQEGRLAPVLATCDLAALARAALERLRPQFDDAGVQLQITAPDVIAMEADADRVTQVLTNLLGNALVATPHGGRVAVDVGSDAREAWVQVSDSGVGLAREDLTRIFERFYRAANGVRRSQGSGIGLTIAREIARAHGGTLTATSDGPGRGSSFRLTLPRHSR